MFGPKKIFLTFVWLLYLFYDSVETNEECWWSGCQPSSWAIRGCPDGLLQTKQESCEGESSLKYYCCPPPVVTDNCWWTGCQPTSWAERGCPGKLLQRQKEICDDGDSLKYNCCDGTSETTGNDKSDTSTKNVFNNEKETGLNSNDECKKDYKQYIRNLLQTDKERRFQFNPLKCTDIDQKSSLVLTTTNDTVGVPFCRLCPNLPFQKITGVSINGEPLSRHTNSDFGNCFSECYNEVKCVAFSFDQNGRNCDLYNSTVGQFVKQNKWNTVVKNQPTGVVKKWIYSRHTVVRGQVKSDSQAGTFLQCLEICDRTVGCKLASYNLLTRQCTVYSKEEQDLIIDYEYGNLAAFDLESFHDKAYIDWRFSKAPTVKNLNPANSLKYNSSSNCSQPNEYGLKTFYNLKCLTSGGLGCDYKTGCTTCYYPEKIKRYRRDLQICRNSKVLRRETVKHKLKECLRDCLNTKTCLGIDFTENELECNHLNEPIPKPNSTRQRFFLQYPLSIDNDKTKINFNSTFDLQSLNNLTTFQPQDVLNCFSKVDDLPNNDVSTEGTINSHLKTNQLLDTMKHIGQLIYTYSMTGTNTLFHGTTDVVDSIEENISNSFLETNISFLNISTVKTADIPEENKIYLKPDLIDRNGQALKGSLTIKARIGENVLNKTIKEDTVGKQEVGVCVDVEANRLPENGVQFVVSKEQVGSSQTDDKVKDQVITAATCGKRIVGYFPSWGDKHFTVNQAQRLTHVIFAFLKMNSDGYVSIGNNKVNDDAESKVSLRRLKQVMETAAKAPHLKVMFSVGGWANSEHFSDVTGSPVKRLNFVSSVIENMDTFKFDGIDIDWEFPFFGGSSQGVPEDKDNYIRLLKDLRIAFDNHAKLNGRLDSPYSLSFAGTAAHWTLQNGYDIPEMLKYANWVNVMAYDFFGPWSIHTGPPAPLYFAMPDGYPGKINVDWIINKYACLIKDASRMNLGIPFYGRYWKNVGAPFDSSASDMWRHAHRVNGTFEGGHESFRDILVKYIRNPSYQKIYDEEVEAPFAWNQAEQIFLGYEDQRSIKAKVDYAAKKDLGGLMVWAIDQDDDDLSLLKVVSADNLCQSTESDGVSFKCVNITKKRWWNSEDGDEFHHLCGSTSPLYEGHVPICDPEDPGYSCCGSNGICGSGKNHCNCETCIDYSEKYV